MMKQIVGMVLAGGRVDELSVLTAKRPKSALPVWGMYRIIDFALTNMMRAGIEVVGVLAQYRPYSLANHLGYGEPWDYMGRSRFLRVLSPFKGADDSDWYKGTADALYQNLNFMFRSMPRYVIIASGDHVCSMDYRPMIRQHMATGADLTMAFKKVPISEANQFGTALLDPSGRVLKYQEKGERPLSDLASLTVYVFNFDVLVERLRENALEGRAHQIYSEVIPRMVDEAGRVFGYVSDGYWRYARTLDAYYNANMEILSENPPGIEKWNLRTNLDHGEMGDPVPAFFTKTAMVNHSLVSFNAEIKGTVQRSVLSPGVVVSKGAVVRDSVILHGCVIGEDAVVDRTILDKGVRVGRGARLCEGDFVPNTSGPAMLSSGISVVGKDTVIPDGTVIGRNCIIHPDLGEIHFPGRVVRSGTTVTA
jgi:glucose-1-phosphate adenylyltransferase